MVVESNMSEPDWHVPKTKWLIASVGSAFFIGLVPNLVAILAFGITFPMSLILAIPIAVILIVSTQKLFGSGQILYLLTKKFDSEATAEKIRQTLPRNIVSGIVVAENYIEVEFDEFFQFAEDAEKASTATKLRNIVNSELTGRSWPIDLGPVFIFRLGHVVYPVSFSLTDSEMFDVISGLTANYDAELANKRFEKLNGNPELSEIHTRIEAAVIRAESAGLLDGLDGINFDSAARDGFGVIGLPKNGEIQNWEFPLVWLDNEVEFDLSLKNFIEAGTNDSENGPDSPGPFATKTPVDVYQLSSVSVATNPLELGHISKYDLGNDSQGLGL